VTTAHVYTQKIYVHPMAIKRK